MASTQEQPQKKTAESTAPKPTVPKKQVQEQKIDINDPSKVVPKDYSIKDINNNNTIHYVYNFINGEYCIPASGEFFDNINPATSKIISRISSSNSDDVEFAVQCAEKAFPSWSNLDVSQRAEYLMRIADLMEKRLKEFALLESRDNGKPMSAALECDIPESINMFRDSAQYAKYVETDALVKKDTLYYLQRPALGIVGGISPWNYPLWMFVNKIAPAIIYGNCIIAKPSKLTPMTAYLLTDVILQSKIPNGVINILYGHGKLVGESIVRHPKIRAISFTGGTQTGRSIIQNAAANIKKVHLELGGKNPSLVLDDCDLEETVKCVALAGFDNIGQVCTACSRIFVHAKIYKEFIEKLKKEVEENYSSKIGDPTVSNYGCLITQQHREKVEKYIEIAKKEGGKIICGGSRPKNLAPPFDKGSFYLPTIIIGLDAYKSKCATEEMFGPVVTVHEWNDEKEVIKQINNSEYGLSASVFTENIKKAHKLAHQIQSGMIWVNCWEPSSHGVRPFGGVKQSGNGRENGKYGHQFYTQCKNIAIKL
eukprot:970792_1